MSRNRRFSFGNAYLLTELKDGIFNNEPAIYVGTKDSDMNRPTMCAVCGQPLGGEGYHSFFLMCPNGRGKDMMIGKTCVKERIDTKELDICGISFKDTWKKITTEFPDCGRWYGTFLHHSIAKPYVKNKKCADRWDESILSLPGVKYIMNIIDDLRDNGWTLDAEKKLNCGNVDLLATHPEKGTCVFDWKSDLWYYSLEDYKKQINRYMSELNEAGFPKISGYILWIKHEKEEYIPFDNSNISVKNYDKFSATVHPSIRCTLSIDMDGGEGNECKRLTKYSKHRHYGNEVSFFIPSFEPIKDGYKFRYFETQPYREGERPQPFDQTDLKEGFYVNFICSKKRHSFTLRAFWERIAPLNCILEIHQIDNYSDSYFIMRNESKKDENGDEYVEFDVSSINSRLINKVIKSAKIMDKEAFYNCKTEWNPEDLHEGMKIRIPCINDRSSFKIIIKTEPKPQSEKEISAVKRNTVNTSLSKDVKSHKQKNNLMYENNSQFHSFHDEELREMSITTPFMSLNYLNQIRDNADQYFTPGRIYASGGKYYGIYKRLQSDRFNSTGKVSVAEVDCQGNKISNLEYRYVYKTPKGKEYIFALTNREWKIYTKDVLIGLMPSDMDRFG